jgi:hypothetical protein
MPGQPRTLRWWIRFALIILALILAALVIFLFLQYRALQRERILNAHEWRWSLFLGREAPLPPGDASVIRAWMTFDYVNKLFALPPDYLRTKLGIADPGYPQLTIAAYAANAGTGTAAALTAVQNAVSGYAAPTASTTPAGATGTPGGGASI